MVSRPASKVVPALAIALDVIAGHRDQLQRLARAAEPREERTASELTDDLAFVRRTIRVHPSPLSARMLSA